MNNIYSLSETTILKYSGKKGSTDGFMGRDSWNPIVYVNGEEYRERVECIIFNKELDKVLLNVKDNKVKLPGGGTVKNQSLESQLIEECKEEVRININYIKFIGEYNVPDTIKRYRYNGRNNHLYFAVYEDRYDGYIRPEDKSSMIDNAKFYDLDEAINILRSKDINLYKLFIDNYKEYIEEIKKNTIIESTEALTESSDFWAFLTKRITIDEKNNKIYLKGIDYNKFLKRIKEMYQAKSVNKLFTKNYDPASQLLWKKKKIPGYKRKIVNIEIDLFFAQELYNILMGLGDFYNMNYYRRMAKYVYKYTYLSKVDKKVSIDVNTSKLDDILNEVYKLKDYQLDFVKRYFEFKEKYELEGYILSFEQGLGKTLTSIAIAELINPDHVFIICMNSLKDNWANEIREYLKRYNDKDTYEDEVYVYGNKGQVCTNRTKYIIVNNESISKVFPYASKAMSSMIIVDESQNFRYSKTQQTKNMLKLKELTKSKDNIMMSGTPIKANPSELVPALMMIDPSFTQELADLYIKSFSSNVDTLSPVVQSRFNKAIYRRTKTEVLSLPQKTVNNYELQYKDETPYLMRTVNGKIKERYLEILGSYKNKYEDVKDEFAETTSKYSDMDKGTTSRYIKFVDDGQDYESIHDSLYDLYDTFIKEHVYPNIKDKEELKRYKYVVSIYVYLTQKCFFLAMGEIVPKVRAKAFIELFDNNLNKIIEMIENNTKKTVIFSTSVDVVKHIHKSLNDNDIGAVMITGEVKDRFSIIDKFKNDDSIDVLVATSQTMGTGVTLTEASQMFIFGPPYRKADFDQASDRIHRIGQTHPVYIYNIVGSCTALDITNRMTNIMEWSDKMTSSIFDNITNEQACFLETCRFINTGISILEYGIYDDIIYEEAIYDSKHRIPVFIVLMHSGTLLANAIKGITGDEYSHACISFNSKLDPMYSFGNKKVSYIGGEPGFVINTTQSEFFKVKKSKYSVYVMYISREEQNKIYERLKWFKEKDEYLGFYFIGLIKYKLGVSSDKNLNKWFCSRFVAELIGQTGKLDRKASLYSPQDLSEDLSFISLVNSGDDISKYDYKVTEKALKEIRKISKLTINQ